MHRIKIITMVQIMLVTFLPALLFPQPSGGADGKKVSLILVGHGGVANDFPKLKEYFKLHGQRTEAAEKIENELIHWPRTEQNDTYWAGFMKVADELKKAGVYASVHVAFNEMCAPTVEEALNETLKDNPDTIILTSIMITPGGGHSEKDIPTSIKIFKERNPNISILYAWPYDVKDISSFLISHVNKFTEKATSH